MKPRNFTLRVQEETLKKVTQIANYNGISTTKQIIKSLNEYIKNHEEENGKIIK